MKSPFTKKFIEFCETYFVADVYELSSGYFVDLWDKNQEKFLNKPRFSILYESDGTKHIESQDGELSILSDGLRTARTILNQHVKYLKHYAEYMQIAQTEIFEAYLFRHNIAEKKDDIERNIKQAAWALNCIGSNALVVKRVEEGVIFQECMEKYIRDLCLVVEDGEDAEFTDQEYLQPRTCRYTEEDKQYILDKLQKAEEIYTDAKKEAKFKNQDLYMFQCEAASNALVDAARKCLSCGLETMAAKSVVNGFGYMFTLLLCDCLRLSLPEPESKSINLELNDSPEVIQAIQLDDLSKCHCTEELFFALADSEREFSLGLRTILQCIDLAEKNGNIPKLPDEWWIQVMNRHYMSEDDFLVPVEKEEVEKSS